MISEGNILKKILLGLILAMLFLPLIQENLKLFDVRDLKGDFKTPLKVEFTPEYWFEAQYQPAQERYLDKCFGFRNTFVRLNNQLRFSLFGKTRHAEAFLGKDGWLFAGDYIASYTGHNFIGADGVMKKSLLLKKVQDAFKEKGIILLPVIAPNKARALHQYLPDTCFRGYSNYEAYLLLFKKLGIDFIDFNGYFATNAGNSPYPLFSKYGVHWSSYGHYLAADSIIRYLNQVHGLSTPGMKWRNTIVMSDSLRDLDYDIAESLNLLMDQMPSEKMAYPSPTFVNTRENKPPLMVIGDSYNFGLELTGIQNKVFSDYKFLYYFRELRPFNGDPDAFYGLDLKQEFYKRKVIILIATEHNMVNYGFGFLEHMDAVLSGKEAFTQFAYDKRVKQFETAIRGDKVWFAKIERDAITRMQNLDSLVTENARYMVDQEWRRK
jgi:hypothetical protein